MQVGTFSFFSGAGFLDLGFELSGFEILYMSELSPAFTEAYKHSRLHLGISCPRYGFHSGDQGDIQTIVQNQGDYHLHELIQDARKDIDVIGFIGGSPCPDFSVGGKNRGREGDHGKLSGSYIELICQHKPDFFLFENVKGLWQTKQHRAFFDELKVKLHHAGYILTERLINAIEYGVPQARDRIILVGFRQTLLEDLQIKGIYERSTIPEFLFPWKGHILYFRDQVFSYPWSTTDPFVEDSLRKCPSGVPEELTAEFWFRKNDVSRHPNSEHYFQPRQGLQRFLSVAEGDDSRKSFKRLHRWRYSPTVCYGNNEVHLHPYKARRLSVAESLALQSLPRDFVFPDGMSLTNMFKAIGNGVPYMASRAIATTILDFLKSPQSYPGLPLHQPCQQLELPLVSGQCSN
jgi:DNA (cytosine-5)-methyltransferase 1